MTPKHRKLIERTLHALTPVQDDDGLNILMAKPDFWDRCHQISLDVEIIYVDGFVGACKWNSWRVVEMYANDELQIFQGYALSGSDGRWLEHCWLMSENRLIETTGQFAQYYGAALNESELSEFNAAAAMYQPDQHSQGLIWTQHGPGRFFRSMTSEFQLGKRRDRRTGEIIEKLLK